MSRTWYGSIDNRIEEGRNYNDDSMIHEGDDITMYYWSDRHCYYVTKVIDQKHIFVHRYSVCADHEKAGGMGHQDWLYFKTIKEERKYINDCIDKGLIKGVEKDDLDSIVEDSDEEWVFRKNKWRQVGRYNLERWNQCLEQAKKECRFPDDEEKVKNVAQWIIGLNDEELEKVLSGKELVKYFKLGGNVSFGVRSYYYDWEF